MNKALKNVDGEPVIEVHNEEVQQYCGLGKHIIKVKDIQFFRVQKNGLLLIINHEDRRYSTKSITEKELWTIIWNYTKEHGVERHERSTNKPNVLDL